MRIRALAGLGAWALADQLLSSGTNFLVGIVIARSLGPEGLGSFTLAFGAWLVMSSFLRAFITQPYMMTASGLAEREWREDTACAAGAQLVLGLAAGVILVSAGLAVGLGGPTGSALVAVGVFAAPTGSPGLLALRCLFSTGAAQGRRERWKSGRSSKRCMLAILIATTRLPLRPRYLLGESGRSRGRWSGPLSSGCGPLPVGNMRVVDATSRSAWGVGWRLPVASIRWLLRRADHAGQIGAKRRSGDAKHDDPLCARPARGHFGESIMLPDGSPHGQRRGTAQAPEGHLHPLFGGSRGCFRGGWGCASFGRSQLSSDWCSGPSSPVCAPCAAGLGPDCCGRAIVWRIRGDTCAFSGSPDGGHASSKLHHKSSPRGCGAFIGIDSIAMGGSHRRRRGSRRRLGTLHHRSKEASTDRGHCSKRPPGRWPWPYPGLAPFPVVSETASWNETGRPRFPPRTSDAKPTCEGSVGHD